MRSDASALLQKLNRQGLNYRLFPDRYADLELWPIFEALLNDPRIVERHLSRVEQRESEFVSCAIPDAAFAEPTPSAGEHSVEQQFSSLLSAYGPKVDSSPDAPPLNGVSAQEAKTAKPDLRAFLNHLGAQGQ